MGLCAHILSKTYLIALSVFILNILPWLQTDVPIHFTNFAFPFHHHLDPHIAVAAVHILADHTVAAAVVAVDHTHQPSVAVDRIAVALAVHHCPNHQLPSQAYPNSPAHSPEHHLAHHTVAAGH